MLTVIKRWLQDCCHVEGFGYYRTRIEEPALLGADGQQPGPPVSLLTSMLTKGDPSACARVLCALAPQPHKCPGLGPHYTQQCLSCTGETTRCLSDFPPCSHHYCQGGESTQHLPLTTSVASCFFVRWKSSPLCLGGCKTKTKIKMKTKTDGAP